MMVQRLHKKYSICQNSVMSDNSRYASKGVGICRKIQRLNTKSAEEASVVKKS